MKKNKTFDFANNYIEGKIAELIGIKAEKMGYDEDGSRYYYWYDKNNYETLNKKRHEIEFIVNKVENKDIMIGLLNEDTTYKDYCMLIVGINNWN
jgi:hypothetical protein